MRESHSSLSTQRPGDLVLQECVHECRNCGKNFVPHKVPEFSEPDYYFQFCLSCSVEKATQINLRGTDNDKGRSRPPWRIVMPEKTPGTVGSEREESLETLSGEETGYATPGITRRMWETILAHGEMQEELFM
jgi:hypothetical protein